MGNQAHTQDPRTGVRAMMDAIMDAIEHIPFPEKLEGWHRVILISVKGQEDLCYEVIIQGDQWQLVEGRPQSPDLILCDHERDIVRSLTTPGAGVTMRKPDGATASLADSVKCGIVVGTFARFVREQSDPDRLLAEARADDLRRKALARENDLRRKSLEYSAVSKGVNRILAWVQYVVPAMGLYTLGWWLASRWLEEEFHPSSLYVVLIVFLIVLLIKVVIEFVNYRRYHKDT